MSRSEDARFTHFGDAFFSLFGRESTLALYWLEGYGGGMFLSFTDETSGEETYGAGRYLLDTVKGADLGAVGRKSRARLQLRVQPVLRIRLALGMPARPTGESPPLRRACRRAKSQRCDGEGRT